MLNLFCLKKSLKSIPISDKLVGKNILFVTLRGFPFVLHQEMFLANILARNGAKVSMLIDDGHLNHWDTYQIHEASKVLNPSKGFIYKMKRDFIIQLYNHPNISVKYLSEFLKEADKDVERIKIVSADEQNAVSSVRRYFECGYYSSDNAEHMKYYNESLDNIKKLRYAISLLNTEKVFKAAITSHGIYSLWGTVYQYMKEQHIPVYVYGAHAYKNQHTHFTNTLAQTLSLDSSWLKFGKETKLTEEMKLIVDEYFLLRRNHTTKDTSVYYSWMTNVKNMNIKKNNGAKNYAMFPNIIWDGDVVQRDTIFNGMLDWMTKTIQYFINHPKNNLIIKYHPAEATLWKDTVKTSDVIAELFPNLKQYKNIVIIASDQSLDTYSFSIENVDVGLVYDGILSLELTHLHIPVISPSCNRFTGGHFVLSPKTQKDYFELLETCPLEDYFTKEKEVEFYKYSYWYLYESAYIMPMYDKQEFGHILYDKESVKTIKSKEFMKFVNKITSICE